MMVLRTTEGPVREVPESRLTLEEQLIIRESEVTTLGMSERELDEIRKIGSCHTQKLERIALLQRWIDDNF